MLTGDDPSPTTDAWIAWIDAPGGLPDRRKLIVQIINAQKLAYKWESFERAIQNIAFIGGAPAEAQYTIDEALRLAKRHKWSASSLMKEFR